MEENNGFYSLGIDKAEEFYQEVIKYANGIELKCGTKARLQFELGVNFILSAKANENAFKSFNKLKGDFFLDEEKNDIMENS